MTMHVGRYGHIEIPTFLEDRYTSLSEKEEQEFLNGYEMLPENCPEWCEQQMHGHLHALIEGNPIDDSGAHRSEELRINTDRVLLETSAVLAPAANGVDIIACERRAHQDYSRAHLHLTTGEARILARQLLHLADLVDLAPAFKYA